MISLLRALSVLTSCKLIDLLDVLGRVLLVKLVVNTLTVNIRNC